MSAALNDGRQQPQLADSGTTFDCIACLESKTGTPVVVAHHKMCADCFRRGMVPQFEDALKNKWQSPSAYGGVLNIQDFANFFSADFLAEWEATTKERSAPACYRVYRADQDCHAFIDSILNANTSYLTCMKCQQWTCIKCDGLVSSDDLASHECTDIDTVDEASDGLVRGQDYQICYRCGIRGSLVDGCNHMRCACSAEYCYLCGAPATADSGHWSSQGCPRYGQPGQAVPPANPIAPPQNLQEWFAALVDVLGDLDRFEQRRNGGL